MAASCLVCCHFVTQLDMVFQFGFGSSWISHDSYCIYYECLLILSWVSSGYVSGWWGVLFDPKVSLHRAKKDTSFKTFTFVDFTHFKRDLGSRLHDFFWEFLVCVWWTSFKPWRAKDKALCSLYALSYRFAKRHDFWKEYEAFKTA